jgi:tetratricopeptide (TPR) repeat protein
MNNLAVMYGDFGRHHDALALFEKTLEIRRRLLSENDPEIGERSIVFLVFTLTRSVAGDAMNNVANTYKALGRFQEALVLREQTLQLYRRSLPENHPDIGVM